MMVCSAEQIQRTDRTGGRTNADHILALTNIRLVHIAIAIDACYLPYEPLSRTIIAR